MKILRQQRGLLEEEQENYVLHDNKLQHQDVIGWLQLIEIDRHKSWKLRAIEWHCLDCVGWLLQIKNNRSMILKHSAMVLAS